MYSAKVIIIIQKSGGKGRVFCFTTAILYRDDGVEYQEYGDWGRPGIWTTNVVRKLCAASFEKG